MQASSNKLYTYSICAICLALAANLLLPEASCKIYENFHWFSPTSEIFSFYFKLIDNFYQSIGLKNFVLLQNLLYLVFSVFCFLRFKKICSSITYAGVLSILSIIAITWSRPHLHFLIIAFLILIIFPPLKKESSFNKKFLVAQTIAIILIAVFNIPSLFYFTPNHFIRPILYIRFDLACLILLTTFSILARKPEKSLYPLYAINLFLIILLSFIDPNISSLLCLLVALEACRREKDIFNSNNLNYLYSEADKSMKYLPNQGIIVFMLCLSIVSVINNYKDPLYDGICPSDAMDTLYEVALTERAKFKIKTDPQAIAFIKHFISNHRLNNVELTNSFDNANYYIINTFDKEFEKLLFSNDLIHIDGKKVNKNDVKKFVGWALFKESHIAKSAFGK